MLIWCLAFQHTPIVMELETLHLPIGWVVGIPVPQIPRVIAHNIQCELIKPLLESNVIRVAQ